LELPFILDTDETLLQAIDFQYFGSEVITSSSNVGLYGSGLIVGVGSSKTRKKKAGFFGGKLARAYFTNKRLIVTEKKITMFSGVKEGEIIAIIDYDKIQGITPRKFVRAHNIDLVVKDFNGSPVSVSLNIGSDESERDQFIRLIKENREKLIHRDSKKSELEDPLSILKIRLAKGEISKKEYEELSALLS